jgi:hypothetical protein
MPHAPVIRGGHRPGGDPETFARNNYVNRSVLDGQVTEIDHPRYSFTVLFGHMFATPAQKKWGHWGQLWITALTHCHC